jgi:hypothetical protein
MARKTVIRIIVYEGEEEWVDRTLAKSLGMGINDMQKGTITVSQAYPSLMAVDNPDRENKHANES